MRKKKTWIGLFIMAIGMILFCYAPNSKVAMAQEEQSNEATVEETTPTIIESMPELSSWEEPQRSLEEILNLEQSRVASSGVNRMAPFYIAFQLKPEFSNWVVTALSYQSTRNPSEGFLLDMNLQTESYIGEYITNNEMTAGQWELQEVWVMSPVRVLLCIARTSQEEVFSRFDFTLVENLVVEETSTEEGSLVERPESGSLEPETSIEQSLPAASEVVTPETAPIAPQNSEAIAQAAVSTEVESGVANLQQPVSVMEQQQIEVAAASKEDFVEQSSASLEASQDTSQEEPDTEKTTEQGEESEEEKLAYTETNGPNEWSFLVLIVIFAGAGIILIYIQNRKQ